MMMVKCSPSSLVLFSSTHGALTLCYGVDAALYDAVNFCACQLCGVMLVLSY
jgi:hypothetical protein